MKLLFFRICAIFILNKEKRKKFKKKYIKPLKIKNIINDQICSMDGLNFIKCSYTDNEDLIIETELHMTNSFFKFDNNVYFSGENFVSAGTKFGRYSYIGDYTKIDSLVSIGRYCSIANNVLIGATIHPTNWLSSSPFQYDFWLDPECPKKKWVIAKPTSIGNDVWIGASAIIQSGIKVGDGAIIGSGAVVTHDVPPYAVVVGVPARILRYRFPAPIIKTLLSLRWWDQPHDIIRQLPFDNISDVIKRLS